MNFFSGGTMQLGGMLFFGIMVLGLVRRKAGNVVARSQYPSLGEKLGLKYTPSQFKNGVGRLDGTFQGYSVSVDPDDQRRIFLRFDSSPQVEMHSYVHNKRALGEMRAFRPPAGVLASQFKTAHATKEIEARLAMSERLAETLRPLKFQRALKTLSVTPSGVTAVFDFGNPPYIPAPVIEDILPRLACLAQTIEGACSN